MFVRITCVAKKPFINELEDGAVPLVGQVRGGALVDVWEQVEHESMNLKRSNGDMTIDRLLVVAFHVEHLTISCATVCASSSSLLVHTTPSQLIGRSSPSS